MPAWLLCKAPGAGGNIRLPRDVTEEKRTGFGDTHRTWSYLKSFFFHRQELSFMGQKTKCRYETLEPAHVQPRSWGPRQLEQWDGRELASSTKVTLACGSNLCLWKASKNFCELSIPTAPKQNTAKETLLQGCGYWAPTDRQRPKVQSIHQHGIRFILLTKPSHAREENSIK